MSRATSATCQSSTVSPTARVWLPAPPARVTSAAKVLPCRIVPKKCRSGRGVAGGASGPGSSAVACGSGSVTGASTGRTRRRVGVNSGRSTTAAKVWSAGSSRRFGTASSAASGAAACAARSFGTPATPVGVPDEEVQSR